MQGRVCCQARAGYDITMQGRVSHLEVTVCVLSQRLGGIGACTSTSISISTRVPARPLANPIARRPNISESHSETRVLEYPFSTPFRHTKGYLRVLGGGRASSAGVALGESAHCVHLATNNR